MSMKSILCGTALIVIPAIASAQAPPEGTWRGESSCATEAPACHNEKVFYYIRTVPEKTVELFVRADKLVGGKPVTMGSGAWKYDRAGQTLSRGPQDPLWTLKIKGNRMEGTLTVG